VSLVIVDSAVYRKGVRIVDDLPPSELGQIRKLACEPGDFVWVGLHEPSEAELATVEEEFGLHPLAVEDAFTAHQRPKLERYEHTLFLTVKSLWYVDADDAVETGEINMFVGPDFVITVRHGSGSDLHIARRDLEAKTTVQTHGPSAVV
jgi:magnesium transporter